MSKYSPLAAAFVFLGLALICKFKFVELGTNFALFGALSIFCGAYLRGISAWLIPVLGIVLSDFLGEWLQISGVHRYDFQSMMFNYLGIASMVGAGHLLRLRDSAEVVVGSVLFGSLLFFMFSNFGSWLNPLMNYDRSLSGLLNCYWMGIPFFKYTFLSDLIFTVLFVGAHRLAMSYANATERVTSSR